jgi:AraC-like DNA-binding protein
MPSTSIRARGVDRFLTEAASIEAPYYQEYAPARDLAGFVACTWLRIVRCNAGESSDVILPDGCSDIMVWDDQPPRVAGPDAVTRHAPLRDGMTIVSIRLRPGACRAILGCAASEIVNGGALLGDLAPGAGHLHRALLLSGDLAERRALLEGWVRSALTAATTNDRAVIAACRMLGVGSRFDVVDVARRLDWNVRMIHRQFVAACGYSPKHFQKIMRIQGLLRLARHHAPGRLADLAAAGGYADQSHMTRDFRAITGFTPSAYLANRASSGWGAWIDGW